MLTKEELEKIIEENKESEVLKKYAGGTEITPDGVKAFLATDEGKRLIQPTLDQYHDKGLKTWKENNLKTIVEDEIKKRFPDETEEQKRIRNLEKMIEDERKARSSREIENKATKLLVENSLSLDFVPFISADSEEEVVSKVSAMKKIVDAEVQKAISEKFKESGRVVTQTDLDKVKKNPWSKESFNLTEQARILREDPQLAEQLRKNRS